MLVAPGVDLVGQGLAGAAVHQRFDGAVEVDGLAVRERLHGLVLFGLEHLKLPPHLRQQFGVNAPGIGHEIRPAVGQGHFSQAAPGAPVVADQVVPLVVVEGQGQACGRHFRLG